MGVTIGIPLPLYAAKSHGSGNGQQVAVVIITVGGRSAVVGCNQPVDRVEGAADAGGLAVDLLGVGGHVARFVIGVAVAGADVVTVGRVYQPVERVVGVCDARVDHYFLPDQPGIHIHIPASSILPGQQVGSVPGCGQQFGAAHNS